MNANDFSVMYHNSRDPYVQMMREIHTKERRMARAIELAHMGKIVDKDIDVDQHPGPLVSMQMRRAMGFPWVPSILQPPLAAPDNGPMPTGAIRVTTDPDDYKAVVPGRRFGLQDFFTVVNVLVENKIVVQNDDRTMMLPMDAEEATKEDLRTYLNAPPPRFAGALLHYGIVIPTGTADGSRVFDAEQISLLLPDIDAVREYIATHR